MQLIGMPEDMKILHDWDRTWISGKWAKNRGISLICYALSRKFPLLNRIKYFHENSESIRAEQLAYMETLIKLDKLCGVTSVFGIRDIIKERYGKKIDGLTALYDIDVRRHVHIGKNSDPNRTRTWEPYLYQPMENWSFDNRWINARKQGRKLVVNPNMLAGFHVDYPHHLSYYIAYLYEVMEDKTKL